MKLKRSSWLYRWAFSMSAIKPRQVSLCSLFWRVVLFTPIAWGLLIGAIGVVLVMLFVMPTIQLGWWGFLLTPSILLALWLAVWLFIRINTLMYRASLGVKEDGLLLSYIKAKKARWCPIITVERD